MATLLHLRAGVGDGNEVIAGLLWPDGFLHLVEEELLEDIRLEGRARLAGHYVEEKTEFNVVLKSFDDTKKIPVIKEVRAITGLGLKEAKDLVEAGEKTLKENVSKEEAAKIKTQVEAAGGVVEIQ